MQMIHNNQMEVELLGDDTFFPTVLWPDQSNTPNASVEASKTKTISLEECSQRWKIAESF
jgi:hypothetical protein